MKPLPRLQRGSFRLASLTEERLHALEARGLVAVEDDAVLAAEPRRAALRLHYAFPDRDAFRERFPSMLDALLAKVTPAQAPLGAVFRLTDRPARPYIEPVLRALAFEPVREWMEMRLAELPDAPAPDDAVAPGARLRPARPDDADAIAEIDAAAFLSPELTSGSARDLIGETPVFRVIEVDGRAAGYLRLRRADARTGYVSDIALRPDAQGRGLGEAMMRWALARFRSEGLSRAALEVRADNARAIALYRKLGFVVAEMGLDYRRPLDPEELRQALERRRTTRITVRRPRR